ncbi:hypothetical protein CVD28_26140 [Bacillus sp. M6-12]|uniref:response regulator transcription factor n=1 Tax=Bacillus sp. M6-12 TaxID=2054166 RepID=UPI000C767489|nr:response regulator transcription factor [Bacillus sp. M6-12]PLS14784.1 hypothetical protein CVD28_26140 [Bacillus sp. M6-12]
MNILVAERSDFQRNGLKWMLDSSGYKINQYIEVQTSEDFFIHVNQGQHHLIIIDVDMLQADEWESFNWITKQATVVGVSEKKDFDLAVRCLELGFFRLYIKPLAIQAIMDVVRDVSLSGARELKNTDSNQELNFIKEQWVSSLIFGQVTHLKEIWDQATILGFPKLPSVVIICKVSQLNELVKNKSDLWKKQLLLTVYEKVEEFSKSQSLISLNNYDEFVLLYIPKKGEQKQNIIDNVKQLSYQLFNLVQKETGYNLFIAIGNEYKDPMLLYHSYNEAKKLEDLQFYFSGGKIIFYGDYPQLYNSNIIEEIEIPSVEDGLTKEKLPFIFSELENNLNLMKQTGVSPIYFKVTLLYILSQLSNHFIKNEKDHFKFFFKQSESIINSETIEQIMPEVKKYLTELTEINAFSLQHIVIEKALDFIHSNYTSSITLEDVSNYVKRSPYYFSHLFKKVMNLTFVEYLTNLRIKKAKELLMEGDYTISEIALLVGYHDPNYFSRVFKAFSGDSPKQWKTQKYLETTKK